MRLSLLDRSRTRTGYPDSAALNHTIERAVSAERLGYHRFWVAEHHAVPGIASASPPVLLGALGARTTSIRIGSGGVMLPHHQPLVVAEQFLMLDALYPDRADLGVGRTLGFTAPVRRALRHGSDAPDTFVEDVEELRSYLDGTAAVTARPVADRTVPVFVLATGRGLAVAARLGLPVVVGGPLLDRPELTDALAAYRKEFRPSPRAPEPSVTVSTDVLVADTDADARELALPEAWAMARSRQTASSARWSPSRRSVPRPGPASCASGSSRSSRRAPSARPPRWRAGSTGWRRPRGRRRSWRSARPTTVPRRRPPTSRCASWCTASLPGPVPGGAA